MLITAIQLPCYLIYTSYLAKLKYFPWDIELSGLTYSSFPSLITKFPSHREESTKAKVQRVHLNLEFMFTTPI